MPYRTWKRIPALEKLLVYLHMTAPFNIMLLQHSDSIFEVLGLQVDAKEARNKMGIPKVGKQHPRRR